MLLLFLLILSIVFTSRRMQTDSVYRITRKYRNSHVLWNVPWLTLTSHLSETSKWNTKLDKTVFSLESSTCIQRLVPKIYVVLKCPQGRHRASNYWSAHSVEWRNDTLCSWTGWEMWDKWILFIYFLWWWKKMWERLRRRGWNGARNVKTLAIPLWSSSAKHCPFPSSIFQMPGPQQENTERQPSAWHSLRVRGGDLASICCCCVWSPDIQCG